MVEVGYVVCSDNIIRSEAAVLRNAELRAVSEGKHEQRSSLPVDNLFLHSDDLGPIEGLFNDQPIYTVPVEPAHIGGFPSLSQGVWTDARARELAYIDENIHMSATRAERIAAGGVFEGAEEEPVEQEVG